MLVPNRALIACLLLAALLQSAPAAQPRVTSEPTPEELDEVIVVGRMPGPPLWKISNGENVLWILPLVDFIPRMKDWDTRRLERLISQSQEYLYRPTTRMGFAASINPLSVTRALGLFSEMTYLPRGTKLSEVVPRDLYRRYQALKSSYFPRSFNMETHTIGMMPAAMASAVAEREELEPASTISRKISEWPRKHKGMRHIWPGVSVDHQVTAAEMKALRKMLDEVEKSPGYRAHQLACFERAIAYFESDFPAAKRRAIAWAQGRADDLISPTRPYPDECGEPWSGLLESPAAGKLREQHPDWAALLFADVAALRAESRDKWLAAAERALERNASTFSQLMVDEMFGPAGLVTRLEEKGYKVEISAEPVAN